MIEHDANRERELQNLCKQVLYSCPQYYREDDFNHSCYYCCFCDSKIYDYYIPARNNKPVMSLIKHSPSCAYLIAKDLQTEI